MNEKLDKNLLDRFLKFQYAVELLRTILVYAVLSFINLRVKLWITGDWFRPDKLEANHNIMVLWKYTNNEQSRIFQWMIPEAIHRVTGCLIPYAYMFQRWFFIMLAFICFHFFLRKWFKGSVAFGAVCFLAAIMPLSYMNYLQESFSLLMLSYVVILWLIRENKTWFYCAALLFASMNNETVLILPAVFFLYNFKSWKFDHLAKLSGLTLLTCAPAYLWTAWIRYYTVFECHAKHLGGGIHWFSNIRGIWFSMQLMPYDYWRACYLYIFFVFGVFWIYACLKYKEQPKFLRRASLIIPVFVLCHLITGRIEEVRQMLPLAFIIVPLGMLYMFPELRDDLPKEAEGD